MSALPPDATTSPGTLSYTAEGCIDPGVGLGASPSCAARPDKVDLGKGDITTLSSTTRTFTDAAPTLTVKIPAIIFAQRNPIDQFNGVSYLVVYTLTSTDAAGATSQVVAIKRIIASKRTTKNTNPSITDIKAGDQGLQSYLSALKFTGAAQTAVTLTPVLSDTSAESFDIKGADLSVSSGTETLTTTWFLSDGDMEYFRTTASTVNTWTPPSTRPTRPGVVMVVVTRDGRGGEDFRKFEF